MRVYERPARIKIRFASLQELRSHDRPQVLTTLRLLVAMAAFAGCIALGFATGILSVPGMPLLGQFLRSIGG